MIPPFPTSMTIVILGKCNCGKPATYIVNTLTSPTTKTPDKHLCEECFKKELTNLKSH